MGDKKWILCEERKPEVGQKVLVCTFDGTIFLITYEEELSDQIMAWMCLPEPLTTDNIKLNLLLTFEEAYIIANLISSTIFDYIRNNPEIESMEWLKNVVHGYEKLCKNYDI